MKHTKKKLIFKNKKAVGNDVDWIIAMGIFLIYLVMTLVYFKPGVKPVFNPQNLLDIVDDNFGKTAYWEVTTQPMFVSKLRCSTVNVAASSGGPSAGDGRGNPTANGGASPSAVGGNQGSSTPSCPVFDNTQIFEFKGSYKNGSTNYGVTLDNSISPLANLNQEYTQIFFVKPNTTVVENTNVVTNRQECTPTPSPSTPIAEQLRGQYNTEDSEFCKKNDCAVRNEDDDGLKRCKEFKEHDESKKKEERRGDATYETKIAYCRELLAQITEAKAQLARGENCNADIVIEPTQDNPVAPNELVQDEFRDGYIKFNATDGHSPNLKFKVFLIKSIINDENKTKYLITTSNRKINDLGALTYSPFTTASSGGPAVEPFGACLIPNYIPSLTVSETSPCFAKYELGVAETLKGIYLPGIASYASLECAENKKGYECVKLMWGYPELKEFKIRVYTPDQKPIAEFPKEPIIPTNVNIYSRQYNTFVLNDDGLKKPVTVSILVW